MMMRIKRRACCLGIFGLFLAWPSYGAKKNPELVITTPEEGAVISTPQTVVVGRVVPGDAEVSVNGVPAVVQHGVFVANGVPLEPGENVLTATLEGETLVATRRVVSEAVALPCIGGVVFGPRAYLRLTGTPILERATFSAPDPTG